MTFESNTPQLYSYERRKSRSDWQPTIDTPPPTAEQPTTKQPTNQNAIQNLLNPSGDTTDNPYDFGANLGDM